MGPPYVPRQYVSPVIIVETIIALFGLLDLRRPEPGPGEASFPPDRRFGRLQFDDNNLGNNIVDRPSKVRYFVRVGLSPLDCIRYPEQRW